MKFTNVLHVPGFGANLLSVKHITSSVDILNPSAETVGGGKYVLLLIDQFASFLEMYVQKLLHPTTGRVSIPPFVNVCANAFDVKIGT